MENFAKRHEPKKVSGTRMHRKKQIHYNPDDESCARGERINIGRHDSKALLIEN